MWAEVSVGDRTGDAALGAGGEGPPHRLGHERGAGS